MEFNIEVSDVTAVLLADGWHSVSDTSFKPGMGLFTDKENPSLHGGYDVRGFQWRDPVGVCFCPAAAVLGLRYNAESSKKAQEIADALTSAKSLIDQIEAVHK